MENKSNTNLYPVQLYTNCVSWYYNGYGNDFEKNSNYTNLKLHPIFS